MSPPPAADRQPDAQVFRPWHGALPTARRTIKGRSAQRTTVVELGAGKCYETSGIIAAKRFRSPRGADPGALFHVDQAALAEGRPAAFASSHASSSLSIQPMV